MNAQYTRMLAEEARAALADRAASGASSLNAAIAEGDRELRARERIRREIVREHFGVEAEDDGKPKPALAGKLARLLRLS